MKTFLVASPDVPSKSWLIAVSDIPLRKRSSLSDKRYSSVVCACFHNLGLGVKFYYPNQILSELRNKKEDLVVRVYAFLVEVAFLYMRVDLKRARNLAILCLKSFFEHFVPLFKCTRKALQRIFHNINRNSLEIQLRPIKHEVIFFATI